MKKKIFSQKLNEIRRKEKSGEITFNLDTRRYYFEDISEEDINQIKNGGFSKPLRIQWRITKNCNLKCKHCYLNDKNNQEKELSSGDLKKIARKIVREKIFEVLVTGGEPTTKEGFYEIMKILLPSCFVTIFTNATWNGFPENFKKLIKTYPRQIKIYVSIDGLEKVHNSIRGDGMYKITMGNIQKLKTQGAEVVVNTVLTKNLLIDLESYLNTMEKEKIEVLQLSKFYPLGEGKLNRDLMPSPKEFEKAMTFLLNYSTKKNKMKIIFDNNFSFLITGKIPPKVSRRCSGGISKLIIETNGDCFPCQLLPFEELKMGNFLVENLDKIWNSEPKKKFIKPFFPKECQNCKHRSYCNSGCKATSYSISKTFKYKDPYCFKWKN